MFTTYNLIRYAIAYVFICSGLMKVLSQELANSFLNLGLPYPNLFLYVVILLEVICGVLILIKKEIQIATIPLIAIMIGALFVTKLPLLKEGIFQFAFNARLDIVMLLLLIVLYRHSK